MGHEGGEAFKQRRGAVVLTGGLKSVLIALALAGSFSVVGCGPAFAGKRMALIIGNASYKNVSSLRNPVNDARGVKEALEKIGFQAELVTDADYRSFRKRLNEFSTRAADAETVLFYYAGHGVEENKTGYLLPTDVEADDLRNPAVSQVPSIDLVATALTAARGPKILIVDACREDPNSRDITIGSGELQVRNVAVRSITDVGEPRAANETSRDEGMLIVFSTAARAVAYDGSGSQGPFAASLIRHLGEPGISAAELFHAVNADVQAETNNQQRTSFYDSLRSAYKLNLGSSEDELAWQKLLKNDDATPEDFDSFLRQFPASAHAFDAQLWRNRLRKYAKERDEERGVAAEARAWEEAAKSNSAEAYANFLAAYPNSAHASEAIQRRDRIAAIAAEAKAWDLAEADGGADALDAFLRAYPLSAHKSEAAKQRDEIRAEASAWAAASKERTPEALDKFAAAYPRSAHKDEAQRLREEALRQREEARAVAAEAAAWAAANKERSADGFEKFARAFPNSAHRADALRLTDELREAAAWSAAVKDNAPAEFEEFARVFPNSAHSQEALRKRDELRDAATEAAAWNAALRDNSPAEFEQFVKVFPNSAHRRDAARRSDELRAAALAAQEKLAWSNAAQAGGADALAAFIDQFPQSAHVAEARRRIGELKAAEVAKADAEIKAEACRREGESLAAKVAAHAEPAEFEALLGVASCAAQRPAVEQALAEAKKAKLAAACAADRATLADAGADPVAVQASLVGMTCEPARQEAKVVLARLQAQETAARKEAEAKALAQRTCDAAGRELDAVDLYAEPARDRVVALRDKSGCADPAFLARAGDKLAEVATQLRAAQQELGRLGCYSASFTGLFDAATKSSLSAYLKADGAAAELASLRVSPDLLEKLRAHSEGGLCGGKAETIVKTPAPATTPVAKAEPAPERPTRPVVAPVAPPVTHAKPPQTARIAPRPADVERERPAPRRAPLREASRPAPEREPRHAAQPVAHPYASAAPAPRPAASSGPSIMFIPN
jgi:outer membrane protein assembly factor BamD (BamD/ComL family)